MQVPGLDTVGHHVRQAAKFSPERPALWLGLRTAAAVGIPLLIGPWIHPVAAGWAPLAGFIVAIVDRGGAYRSRAITMASVAIGGLLAVLGGSLIAGHGPITAVAVALGLTICAVAQAFGPSLVSVGNAIALQLLVAASLPCTTFEAIERTIGFAAGAGFALLLGLLVWPVRVYKPGRRAVSAVYGALAKHTRALASELDRADWRTLATSRHRAIRDQIEVARVVLAATRRGRRGETGRGDRLLAMVQLADQAFGITSGLEEALDAGATDEVKATARGGLEVLADGLAELATNVLVESPPATVTPAWTGASLRMGSLVERTLGAHALALLGRAHADRLAAARVLVTIADDSEPLEAVVVPDGDPRPPIRERLHEVLDLHGVIARHALRVAVAVSAAMVLAKVLGVSHRYWVTVTTFLLLQPQGAATRIRALQRVAGTFAGALIAAAIPSVIRDPQAMLLVVVVLAGTSASILRINYALYATFLTPTFILLAEVHQHDPTLAGTRIANTAIGAGLAILASLAWHIRPSRQFDDQIADAYDAARTHLEVVVDAITNGVPQPSAAVSAARRASGVQINRCEVALDQMLAERAPASATEPRMTQVVFFRRLISAINAFGSTRGVASYGQHHVEIVAFAASTEAALRELAEASRGEHGLVARPRVDRISEDPVLAARLERIDMVVVALVEAALRSRPGA